MGTQGFQGVPEHRDIQHLSVFPSPSTCTGPRAHTAVTVNTEFTQGCGERGPLVNAPGTRAQV
jgi:hypothetical protein